MARIRAPKTNRPRKVPKEFRTRLLFDETESDNGKYYRCSNCGQICHDTEHRLGGSKSGDAVEHFDFSTQSTGITPGDELSAVSLLRTVQKSHASLELGSDGSAKAVVHSHRTTGGGCPLCHSLNWRGDYP